MHDLRTTNNVRQDGIVQVAIIVIDSSAGLGVWIDCLAAIKKLKTHSLPERFDFVSGH